MIRRRRSDRNKAQPAPVNPTSASTAPPAEAVPAGGDEASRVVIDELLAAFSADGAVLDALTAAKPVDQQPVGQQPVDEQPVHQQQVEQRLVEQAFSDPSAEMPTQSTRAMSPSEIVEQVENVPPPDAAPGAELVPEPTRRSARRSKREAKREAKRERKRVAKHVKDERRAQKRLRKQRAKKPSRKSRRRGQVQTPATPDSAAAAGVRVITSEEAAAAAVLPVVPTVRIADDDLPDAVHVDGDLVAGASGDDEAVRPTVFIDEDPNHADVVTMDVAASATRIEPRMRERRIAVRRAVGRRRLKWVAMASSVVLVVVGALAVMGSQLFAIDEIDVEGAVYSRGPAFDEVLDGLNGTNVLRADTGQAERDLEAIPWVADARVTSDFPNGATVEVRERIPSITYQGPDGRYRVLDRDGRVLDVIDGQPTAYLELLVTDGTDLDPGQTAPPGYRAAATLVQALPPQMRQWALSVSATADAADLRLVLDSASVGGPGGGSAGGIEVRFGAAQDLVDKLVRLQTALTNPNPDNAPTEMIDVSTDDVIDR